MKNLPYLNKQLLKKSWYLPLFILFFLILSPQYLSADSTQTDDFGSSLNGWSGDITRLKKSQRMRIDPSGKAEKNYDFGAAYANASTDISFHLKLNKQWEDSGNGQDYIYVFVNGTKVATYSESAKYSDTKTLTATADANGRVQLKIQTDNTADNEYAYIDDVLVMVHTPLTGGQCSSTNGLRGEYYNNNSFTDPVLMSRVDSTINFAWGSGNPGGGINNNNFSIEWTGFIYVPENANYTFELAHDDVFTLVIDGNTVYSSTAWTGGSNNFRAATPVALTQGYHPIKLSFVEWSGGAYAKLAWHNDAGIGSRTIIPSNYLCITDSPVVAKATDDHYDILVNTSLNDNVMQNDTPSGSITVTGYTQPSNGTVSIQTNGNFIYTPNSGYAGSDSFDYSIKDTDSNTTATARITITITNPDAVDAVNDSYSVFTDTALSGNVLGNDKGSSLFVTANTSPANGTLTLTRFGDFEYRSNAGFTGTDTFEYTITDIIGDTDTATVTITVSNDTNYTSGSEFPFQLVNPPFTRNLVGNYTLAGNTVMCLTDHTSTYGGICQDNNAIKLETSNRRISKYIDIDGTTGDGSGTWNSTSSYIDFPTTFDRSQRSRIKWAGLFWQGRISTDNDYVMHFGVKNGSSYNFTNTGKGYNYHLNIENTDANKLKLKIANGNYNDIQASNVYTYSSSGGTTYAAFADVTSLVEGAKVEGNHVVFTVANLTTGEGREPSPGVFGGWSLVVIYNETTAGKLRNISIYNGFVSIDENNAPIKISGFKLPTDLDEDVTSQLAVFSGEGEYRYGRRPGSNNTDYMKISDRNDGGWTEMPGATNPNNIFDAILDGVKRDNVAGHSNNLQINNDGIDVDIFDTTSLMTPWRNANTDMNEVFIKLYSDNDYITPSMIAFSAELYKPNVCYDYVVKRDNYTLPSAGLDINATFEVGETLSITAAIKSLESDVDLTLSALGIDMTQREGHISFDENEAYYSLANTNTLLKTPVTNNSTLIRPEIAIGKNRNPLIGGTIGPYERYFAKFNYLVTDVNSSKFAADFTLELNTTIDYGSGPVTQILPLEQCEQSVIYNPTWLQFNVERDDLLNRTPDNATDRYSLYTQIAGRDFDYSVTAYTKDANNQYTIETPTDSMTVDVELIDASAFDDNTSFLKCANPDSDIILNKAGKGTFVHFSNTSRVPVTFTDDFDETRAVKNTVFRMWILTDENNTIIPHMNEKTDGDKFKIIYDDNFRNLDEAFLCTERCGAQGVAGSEACYDCLRQNFAKPICSRDNFAIRPESYRMDIYDAGENNDLDTAKVHILKNDSTSTNPGNKETLVAKYPYLMKAFSTRDTGDTVATGYYNDSFQSGTLSTFNNDGTSDISLIQFIDNAAQCNDQNHTSLNIDFADGTIRDFSLTNQNVGKYTLWIKDNTWTKVDQAEGNKYKTIFDDNCYLSSAPECNDCTYNNSHSNTNSDDGKYGCQVSTGLPDDDTYTDINITYMPDHFSLSEIAVTKKPLLSTNSNTLYISDLAKDLRMAVSFEGNISALGYNDADNATPLSNYTYGCAAQGTGVYLDINKTILTGAPTSTDVNGTVRPVYFQQALLEYYTLPTATQTLDESDTNKSMVLRFENFEKDLQGKAHVDLYYNFKKPTNAVVNPIDVNFSNLLASAPDANATAYATANTKQINTPSGDRLGDEYIYYFAKVEPGQFFIDDIKEDFIMTALYVQIYCNSTDTSFCENMGLGGTHSVDYPSAPNETEWYSAKGHDGATEGRITGLSVTSGTGTVTPNGTLLFTGGARTDIRVDYTGDTRPGTVTIGVGLDPWLFYSPTLANLEYSIRFTADGNWGGVGNTGNVLKTRPNNKENNRVDW